MCAFLPHFPIIIYYPRESACVVYFGWGVYFLNGIDL